MLAPLQRWLPGGSSTQPAPTTLPSVQWLCTPPAPLQYAPLFTVIWVRQHVALHLGPVRLRDLETAHTCSTSTRVGAYSRVPDCCTVLI